MGSQLEEFFDDNNIFGKNLHGGHKNYENNYISTLLATDLSAAYDTVNTDILLQKMDHYGIHGKMKNIFISYFNDRKQFVRLETHNSIIRNSTKCSIIQGGKMSGFLFNIYCN